MLLSTQRRAMKSLHKGCLSSPAVTLASSRSFAMAADGTSVRSAALCRNSTQNSIFMLFHKNKIPSWTKEAREHIHTYDPPHGLHQPAKGVSWNVSEQQLRSTTRTSGFNLKPRQLCKYEIHSENWNVRKVHFG